MHKVYGRSNIPLVPETDEVERGVMVTEVLTVAVVKRGMIVVVNKGSGQWENIKRDMKHKDKIIAYKNHNNGLAG